MWPANPVAVLAVVAAAMVLRLAAILPLCRRRRHLPNVTGTAAAGVTSAALRRGGASPSVPTAIVWGSGGHTAEMCGLVGLLSEAAAAGAAPPLSFTLHIKAATDTTTAARVATSGVLPAPPTYVDMPRPREVGGSFIAAVWPTVAATVVIMRHLLRCQPALVLMNGPGTCLPAVLAALALRFVGAADPALVFVESACRVQRLSLTGRLVRPLVDVLAVQWPTLAAAVPSATYVGLLM